MKKSHRLLVNFGYVFLALVIASCRTNSGASAAIMVSGLIEAIETDIKAQTQGEVKEIFVKEGQPVKKGDPLCRLDDEKLLLQLKQVEAAIEGAKANVALVKKGTKKELIKIAKNQADIAAKELDQAKLDQERMTRLFGEGAVSQYQKEQADLRYTAARESYKSADENHRLAVRGNEKEQIEMAEAQLENLEAQKRLLQTSIQDAHVASPVDGFLEVKHVEVGELASPGTILFSLIDFSRTYVKAYVPERDVGRIKLGERVEVRTDAYPLKVYPGKVDYISQEAEFAPKNVQTKEERLKLVYMIKSYLDNTPGELKPGMPVDVKIIAE
jgi:HlyD family secretion protein